jgi:hypothetical protein
MAPLLLLVQQVMAPFPQPGLEDQGSAPALVVRGHVSLLPWVNIHGHTSPPVAGPQGQGSHPACCWAYGVMAPLQLLGLQGHGSPPAAGPTGSWLPSCCWAYRVIAPSCCCAAALLG